jgi:hypothetical protein
MDISERLATGQTNFVFPHTNNVELERKNLKAALHMIRVVLMLASGPTAGPQ